MKISNKFYNVMMKASNELTGKLVRVEETTFYGMDSEDGVMKFGVNWSCCGAVDVKVAQDFANALATATEIAQLLNSCQFSIDFDSKTEAINKDNYANVCDAMKNMLKLQSRDWMAELVEKVGR